MNNIHFLMIACLLCASCQKEERKEITAFSDQPIPQHVTAVSPKRLDDALYGKWICTSFDSAMIQKKLNPWLMSDFYGEIILEIDGSDSIFTKGNMDWGKGFIHVADSFSFTSPDMTGKIKPVYHYDSTKDLMIVSSEHSNQLIYRRIKKSDKLDIFADRKAFNNFFIQHLFIDDYFKNSSRPEIRALWDGFETYNAFGFDALEIKDDKGKTKVYGWEFKGDTLVLYNTSSKRDPDSDFLFYYKKDIHTQYIK